MPMLVWDECPSLTWCIPIVAFLNKESDGHVVIKEANCGFSIVSDASAEEAKNFLIRQLIVNFFTKKLIMNYLKITIFTFLKI